MILASVLLLLVTACGKDDIDRLADMTVGTFDTHAIDPDLPQEQRLIDRRIRLQLPVLGEYVFYQQLNHRKNLDVYRQRIIVLSQSPTSGQLEQRAYALRQPGDYVDAGSEHFDSLTMADLEAFMPDGCEQIWTVVPTGFQGYVDPALCKIVSSRTGKIRGIESESSLSNDTLSLTERGYDPDSGEQLFGTAPGESLLLGRLR